MTDKSMSAALDKARATYYGTEPAGEEQTAEQRAAARRKIEDAALARATNRPEDDADRERLVLAGRTLVNALAGLRHGVVYDAEARSKLVDGIVRSLGSDGTAVKTTVRELLNLATNAITEAMPRTGSRPQIPPPSASRRRPVGEAPLTMQTISTS